MFQGKGNAKRKQGRQFSIHPRPLKKIRKKLEKRLDKTPNLWYNIREVKRERKPPPLKSFEKKFENPLDNPPKVWYNKYIKGNDTL